MGWRPFCFAVRRYSDSTTKIRGGGHLEGVIARLLPDIPSVAMDKLHMVKLRSVLCPAQRIIMCKTTCV